MEKRGLILIVEDDSINKRILSNLFCEQFEIMEAENGKEALDIIQCQENKLSVIILDVYMPVVDGYSVLKILSNNNKWRNIPVVVTTSEESVESDQRLLDLGAVTVIHKPINAGIVKRHINNIVDRQKEHASFMKDYMLQKSLIHKTANTFTCAYHFNDQTVVMEQQYS
ncbi:MAG: response regulator [Lachnospiraceae bacterium]|nr:response regulator [Lachnospiraceae bacterium]